MILGFAGAGNMAAAMARGWASAGADQPALMLFCDIDGPRAEALAEEVGGETRASLGDLASDCDVLVLAVKPAALDAVATELTGNAPAILSMLAATTLARIEEAFPDVPAMRLMPNQPAEVRRGVLCHVSSERLPEELERELVELLALVGTPVAIDEELIDAAMAVMSCAPAYVALVAEGLIEPGVREGLDRELAGELVAGTLEGTAALLRKRDPEAIRRAVAPPGGATEAGLEALERGGVVKAFADAVEASLERFR